MDLFANPVTLSGLAAFVALGAWAMGRLQGAAATPVQAGDPPVQRRYHATEHSVADPTLAARCEPALPALGADPATGEQLDPRYDLLSAMVSADSLGELHAEITAFRRQERVLTTMAPDLLPLHCGSDKFAQRAYHAGDFRRLSRADPGSGQTLRPAGPGGHKQRPPAGTDRIGFAQAAASMGTENGVNLRRAYRP